MSGVAIGPIVLSFDRFAALLSALLFMVLSETVARLVDKRIGEASLRTLVAFLIGARAGHVVGHFSSFSAEPLRIFAVFQGGFYWPAGLATALLANALFFRNLRILAWSFGPIAATGIIYAIILQIFGGTPPLMAPDASFVALDGRSVTPARLVGSPMVINLWATWCPPCQRELPMMSAVAAGATDVAFLFANQGETESEIRTFFDRTGIILRTVLLDPQTKLALYYRVPGLPAMLFVDSAGQLRSVTIGEISKENLLAGIENLRQLRSLPHSPMAAARAENVDIPQ